MPFTNLLIVSTVIFLWGWVQVVNTDILRTVEFCRKQISNWMEIRLYHSQLLELFSYFFQNCITKWWMIIWVHSFSHLTERWKKFNSSRPTPLWFCTSYTRLQSCYRKVPGNFWHLNYGIKNMSTNSSKVQKNFFCAWGTWQFWHY